MQSEYRTTTALLKLRIHITRCILLVLTLQLLNLSIYAQDFKPMYHDCGTEEVNINETIVEYVVEVVLGHKNAIPEQSQHPKGLHFHKHISFKATRFERNVLPNASQIFASKLPIPLQESFIDLYSQDIRPQPPKA